MEKERNWGTCIVCEQKKEIGIHILHHFICETCEQKIKLTEPEDESYRHYLEKLKKIVIPQST